MLKERTYLLCSRRGPTCCAQGEGLPAVVRHDVVSGTRSQPSGLARVCVCMWCEWVVGKDKHTVSMQYTHKVNVKHMVYNIKAQWPRKIWLACYTTTTLHTGMTTFCIHMGNAPTATPVGIVHTMDISNPVHYPVNGSDTHSTPVHDIEQCVYIVQSACTLHTYVGNILTTVPRLHKFFQ